MLGLADASIAQYAPGTEHQVAETHNLHGEDIMPGLWLCVKNIAFTLLVPGTVAVYLPVFVLRHPPAAMSPAGIIGAVALLAGGVIYTWCLWHFATTGRGTPAPVDPPRRLVMRGLYRYTRNPMYVGVLCVIGGWALIFDSANLALYGAVVAASFHLMVVVYEEPHLTRTFGAPYRKYCAEVRRWLPLRRARSR